MRSPLLFALAVLVGCVSSASADVAITQPPQPEAGPGGSDYAFSTISIKKYGVGRDAYWIFWPVGPLPDADVERPLPVIGFLHGWGVMDTVPYRAWVDHLVLRGNVVIYPQYQQSFVANPADMTGLAGRAISKAVTEIQTGPLSKTDGFPKVDLDRFALVGHSLGGSISANLANDPERYKVPVAKAVMAVEPGDSRDALRGALQNFLPKTFLGTEKIAKETLLIVVTGEDDTVVDHALAERMFLGAKQVPLENRDYVLFRTDRHGQRPLIANHFIPLAGAPGSRFRGPNAHDYMGLWKLFDGLTDAAFFGINKEYALGGGKEQTSLGTWSDGRAITPLIVTDEP